MHATESQQSGVDKKVRRGPVALTPEARKQAIADLEASFKGREWSDVLTEVLGRKDLEIETYSYDFIGASKAFPVTKEEAMGDVLSRIESSKHRIRAYGASGPHYERVRRDGIWFDEEMTGEQIQKAIKRIKLGIESDYDIIERIKQGKEEQEIEPRHFMVARFPTREVLGDRDADAYKEMGKKSAELEDRFSKLFFKFQSISWQREEELQKGFLGIGNISQLANKTKLDHYLGLLENVRNRLKKEPLLDTKRFIKEHILASAGKKHDSNLVEGFDPQQIEDTYQQYVKKYHEYEDALKPFDIVEKKKSGGPYR